MRLHFLLLVTVLASTSIDLVGQAATYRIVGQSCTTGRLSSGIGPVPISIRGLPKIGTTFSIVTEGTTDYPWGRTRIVFLITGLSNTSASGVPLPLDTSTFFPGQPFCGILRTSFESTIRVPAVVHYQLRASVEFKVPNSRSLLGAKFYQQVLSMERTTFGTPRRAGALSAGGEGVIGL